MPFELFEQEKSGRNRGSAAIRLAHGRNVFTLNAAAKELLGDVRHVRLLFDEENRRMALQPTTADDLNGYAIGQVPSGGNLSARSFAARYALAGGHRWELRKDGDLLVADVNQEPFEPRGLDEDDR